MLERVFTELRQGHRLQWVEAGLQVVNSDGTIKHDVAREAFNPGWRAHAIDLLMKERATWLEGYCAASNDLGQPIRKLAPGPSHQNLIA